MVKIITIEIPEPLIYKLGETTSSREIFLGLIKMYEGKIPKEYINMAA